MGDTPPIANRPNPAAEESTSDGSYSESLPDLMDPEPETLQELEDSDPESLPDLEDQFTDEPYQGLLTLEQTMWMNELESEMNNALEVEVADSRNNE